MIEMAEHPATSIMRFCAAHRDKYRQLLACGDAADQPANLRGKPSWLHQERIEEETQDAIDMIANGMSSRAAARALGMRPGTLQQRLNSRGLNVSKIREEHAV